MFLYTHIYILIMVSILFIFALNQTVTGFSLIATLYILHLKIYTIYAIISLFTTTRYQSKKRGFIFFYIFCAFIFYIFCAFIFLYFFVLLFFYFFVLLLFFIFCVLHFYFFVFYIFYFII